MMINTLLQNMRNTNTREIQIHKPVMFQAREQGIHTDHVGEREEDNRNMETESHQSFRRGPEAGTLSFAL